MDELREDRVKVVRRVITVQIEIDAIAGSIHAQNIADAMRLAGMRLADGWAPRTSYVIDEVCHISGTSRAYKLTTP